MYRSPLRFVEAQRRLPLSAWAIGIVVIWLSAVALYTALARAVENAPSLCLFRNVTNLPCPTCGTTRATLAFARGDILSGVLYNPFVVTVLLIGLTLCAVQWGLRKRIEIALSPGTKRFGWALVTVLFLGNWAYLIVGLRSVRW